MADAAMRKEGMMGDSGLGRRKKAGREGRSADQGGKGGDRGVRWNLRRSDSPFCTAKKRVEVSSQ